MKSFIGILIRKERLNKNYSQEGLCKGICVVSYLSKIEQGKVQAGKEILLALLKRLDITYEMDLEFLEKAKKTIDKRYEKLYERTLDSLEIQEMVKEKKRYLSSPYMLDSMLFFQLFDMETYEWKDYISCMEKRQYELWLYLECKNGKQSFHQLLKQNSNGFYVIEAGYRNWILGKYQQAVELLMKGYLISSEEGTIHNMLMAKMLLGNCYSSTGNQELMMKNYMIAKRIAKALNEEESLDNINYNIASTFLEWNQPQEAMNYFHQCNEKTALYYHKIAICLERLERKKEALEELKKGYGTEDFSKLTCSEIMYEIVEYRLVHEQYIKQPEYEVLLRKGMALMNEQLPKGFIKFHVPYLVEVLKSQRKYKEIYELMESFPEK